VHERYDPVFSSKSLAVQVKNARGGDSRSKKTKREKEKGGKKTCHIEGRTLKGRYRGTAGGGKKPTLNGRHRTSGAAGKEL